jgi:TrmH family RNA methyltransferase
MVTKNEIKQVASLRQQKYRKELGLFVVEGRKMTEELLRSRFEVKALYAIDACRNLFPQAETVTEVQMEQMSGQDTPPGILAVVKIPKAQRLSPSPKFILALDGIANPGNMGTLIRTAEWFGIHDIACSPDCVEVWNPKVIQATMGSIFRINILEADLDTFLNEQRSQGQAVYGALLEGENLFEMKGRESGVIVIGSESHGIRESVLPCITRPITIPRIGDSQTESLNASVAAGIIMAELTRQS